MWISAHDVDYRERPALSLSPLWTSDTGRVPTGPWPPLSRAQTACLKEWGRVKSGMRLLCGKCGVVVCVGRASVRRCGVKVERPQRSEDERP